MCAVVVFLLQFFVFRVCHGDITDILAMMVTRPAEDHHHLNVSLGRDSNLPTMMSLRISCMLQEPYTSLDSSTGRLKGLEIDLVKTLATHLGLTADIELSENRSMLMQKLTNKYAYMFCIL